MPRTRTIEHPISPAEGDDLRTLSEGLADEDPGVREDCAQRLAALKHPEAAPFLRHALDDDEEQVRVWGAYGLGLLHRRDDLAELERAMRDDESPLVRLWATFGCAFSGDVAAAKALVEMLDLPDLELRTNAADALLTLQDPSVIRPLLEKRLALPDERRRVWAAAILHRLGHREAFGIWRDGLVSPKARVHAAMVAAHLKSRRAARELVRVAAELTPDELDAPVAAANDLPLAELLTAPLRDLDLAGLLAEAKDDLGLRADLLLLVLRGPAADPDAMGQICELVASLDPAALGADLAELLSEQDPADRPRLLARTVEFASEAVIPALERLAGENRDRVFDAVADAAAAPDEVNAALAPLLELLLHSPWAQQFADLPDAPWAAFAPAEDEGPPEDLDEDALAELDALSGEDDLGPVIERMAAGEEVTAEERAEAEALLADLGMTAEAFVESLYAGAEEPGPLEPPEAQDVARRVLCLAVLVERARAEAALATGKLRNFEAKSQAKALADWAQAEGLKLEMTAMELDLLDAEPGDWLEEDVALGVGSAEAVAMLRWSIGKGPLPAPDRPSPADAALGELPLRADTEAFVQSAALVDEDALDRARELYETLLWRAEQEDAARRLLAGEEVELELDVDAVLEDLAQDGFDVKAAKAKGPAHLSAEALRFLGRRAAQRLAEEGGLQPIAGDFGWKGKPVSLVDEAALRQLISAAEDRHRAVCWLGLGGEWDGVTVDEDDEEDLDEEGVDDEDA